MAGKGKSRYREELERKIWSYVYFSIYIRVDILFPAFLYGMILQGLQDKSGRGITVYTDEEAQIGRNTGVQTFGDEILHPPSPGTSFPVLIY